MNTFMQFLMKNGFAIMHEHERYENSSQGEARPTLPRLAASRGAVATDLRRAVERALCPAF